MKIVYTLNDVKNIIVEFTQKRIGGEKPTEVAFVHKFSDGSGETEIQNITPIDRVEVRYDSPEPMIGK